MKDKCYRHIAKPDEYKQAYFITDPINKKSCSYYWEQCPMCKLFDGKHKLDCDVRSNTTIPVRTGSVGGNRHDGV